MSKSVYNKRWQRISKRKMNWKRSIPMFSLIPLVSSDYTLDFIQKYGSDYSIKDQMYKKIILSNHHGAAIDRNGNVFLLKSNESKLLLKGYNVMDVSCTQESVYCITSSQKVLKLSLQESPMEWSWLHLFYRPSLPICSVLGLHWNERLTRIESGLKDTFLLTSKGRVFQSQFKESSKESSNQVLNEFKCIDIKYPVAQIACGYTHTLFRMKNGRVFGMGTNLFGQLSTCCKTDEILKTPKEIQTLWTQTRDSDQPNDAICSHIAAGKDFSLFAVDRPDSTHVLSCGTGIQGQLGHGGYNHVQILPVKVKKASDLTEWNESLKKLVPIRISQLHAGASHAEVVLDNVSQSLDPKNKESGKDLRVWGDNSCGQLCGQSIGKKVNSPTRPLKDSQDENSRIQLNENVGLALGNTISILYNKIH